jgi:hypothetical protein
MANTIRFSRSSSTYYSLEGAKTAILGKGIDLLYGEPIIAKYKDEKNAIKLLFGIGTGEVDNPVRFIGTSDDSLEIYERITAVESIIGTGELNTENKTLIEAINELLEKINSLSPGGGISIKNTASIRLEFTEGVLAAYSNVSVEAKNAIQVRTDGLYARDYTEEITDLTNKVSNQLTEIETSDGNVIISGKSEGKQSISISTIDDSNLSDPDTASETKSLSAKATLNLIKSGGGSGVGLINAGDGIEVDKVESSVTVKAKIDNNTLKFTDDKSITVISIDGGVF